MNDTITIGIGTIPGREGQLERTLESLMDQDGAEATRIYVNHKDPHALTARPLPGDGRVRHDCADPDPGDCSKFIWAKECEGWYFACDDDIIYPPDYLATMIEVAESYRRTCLVCVHGINITDDRFAAGYYGSREVFNTIAPLAATRIVHEPGAGTMLHHAGVFDLELAHFPTSGMSDVYAAVYARGFRFILGAWRRIMEPIPVVCVARPAKWLTVQETPDSIWAMNERARNAGENPDWLQTQIMRECGPWT